MSRTLRIAILALSMITVILGMIAMYARDLKGGTEITLTTEPVDPRSLFLGHYATLGYAINRLGEDIIGGHCYEPNAAIFVTLEENTEGDWTAMRAAPEMPADAFGDKRVTLRGRVQWGSPCPANDAVAATEEPGDPATGRAEAAPVDPPAEEIEETEPAADEFAQDGTEAQPEPFVEPAPVFTAWVNYGVEQYFASPDAARKLEDLARRRQIGEDGEPPLEPLEIILSVPRSGRALIKGVVIDGVKTYDQTLW